MTSQLRRKRPITALRPRPAIDAGRCGRVRRSRSLAVVALALVAGGTWCGRSARRRRTAPLFLAPRTADDISLTDRNEVEQASRKRMTERAAAVSNPNLKWKPFRPAPTQNSGSADSQPTRATATQQAQPSAAKRARRASKIPVEGESAEDNKPARRRVARSTRAKVREEILQVSQRESTDPFSEPLDMPEDTSTTEPTEPTEAAPPESSQPDSGAPRTIPATEEPFPDEQLPMPENRQDISPPIEPAPETTSCVQDKRSCNTAREKLKKLQDININIAVAGHEGEQYPCECELSGVFVDRNWETKLFSWKASALCHKPLYFEEVALERYGHSLNPLIQPIFSGVHFFATIPILPYLMGVYPPNECQYVLGYYRPGDCAPWLVPPFPFSLRGAVVEATAVVGGIFIVH